MSIERKAPLTWPEDEPRTPGHEKRAKSLFDTTRDRTERQLEDELRRFRATDIMLSLNNPTRSGRVDDSAIALYFDLPGARKIAICCDLYFQQSDNLRAIYKVIEAMRTIERYGGQHLSQKSFTGFAALPPPIDCWKALKISKGVGEALSPKMRREFVMDAFRERAREGHSGGVDMAQLVEMRDQALRELGVQGES